MKEWRSYHRKKLMESSSRKVKNAIKVIEMYGLDRKTRKQEILYGRYYIMAKLRQIGCTYEMIGELFDKDHATVIHAVNNHNHFTKVSDFTYRLAIEPVKVTYKQLNQEIQLNIYNDVLSCANFEELLLIKEKIHNGMYN